MKQYENIFTVMNTLYIREYDTETKLSEVKPVKYVPKLYIPNNEDSHFKSIITKENLKELSFKTLKEYNDSVKMYKSMDVKLHGLKNRAHNYLREHYGNPTENNHPFRTMYLDIETAILDNETDKNITRNDWKPEGLRAAMAVITSIQMYDTKTRTFFILGLNKEWTNENNYESKHGNIKYINCSTEKKLLKNFLTILSKINPTVIAGWNSEGYDYPYLTMRIIRVLDNNVPFIEYNNQIVFNTEALKDGYVSQLSPVNFVKYRAQETNYGVQHTFQWIGYILEDYQLLYKKYTYTTLTSYSLDSVASHELGANKINHDEFSDFAEFYKNNFNLFIEYGIKDVELLVELDDKLKLIDLAKYLAYHCGVTMDDVRGTLKQWVTFVFNESFKSNNILPLDNKFPDKDDVILKHAMKMNDLDVDKKQYYKRLYEHIDPKTNEYSLRGQSFPGGWTRGTAKFWKWLFSLDFTSLYPSAQMWANIGIDTLIEPKDLPQELLDLRAKYFIYYDKEIDPKEYEKLDYEFIENVLENEKVREEIHNTLVKYNVSATPNGMFFKKDHQSTMSSIIERLIIQRKEYKKSMKETEKRIEVLKKEKEKSQNSIKIDNELYDLNQKRDNYDVYQMGVKIFLNSNYGSQSMRGNPFAGHPEYFSAAITSSSRIANIFIGREQSKKVYELADKEHKEKSHGKLNYLDVVAQSDTDSNYVSIEDVIIKKFGKDYEKTQTKERLIEFTLNYVEKIALPLVRDKLDNVYGYTLNAMKPEKLNEDVEIVADCLPKEVKIQTDKGKKNINDVKVGDLVLSYNEKTKNNEFKKVLNTRKILTNKKLLTISNGTITLKCTEDHKIFTFNRGYVNAIDIKEYDDLLLHF